MTQITGQGGNREMGGQKFRALPRIVMTDEAQVLRISLEEVGSIGLVWGMAKGAISFRGRRVPVDPGRHLLHVVVTRHTQLLLGHHEGQGVARKRTVTGLAVGLRVGLVDEGPGFLLRRSVGIVT
jgi:hypothetical protein